MNNPEQQLEVYLVGGAVRDQLLGIDVKDRDWVVVGSTPEQMCDLGFMPVGKDFPVFLHPETREEYALARTERKTAPGYHGFVFSSDPGVTLEQDLERRDLTMNAIAMNGDGQLTDPFNGKGDIESGIIRHVSSAFKEDPVRILRVAKFAARFHSADFKVDSTTNLLMQEMVANGEASALVPERVWQEMRGALSEQHFFRFIEVLRACGALGILLPEVERLFGVPQVEKYHPEIDTGIHTLMSLKAAGKICDDPQVMFSVLVHDLGKGLTPESELPRHRGHETSGLKPVKQVCDRLGVPSAYRELALKVCEFHLHGHRIRELRPETILKVLEKLDAFRRPEQVEKFVNCCLADKRGRTGHENASRESLDLLHSFHEAALAVEGGVIASRLTTVSDEGKQDGNRIKQAIQKERIRRISDCRNSLGF